MKKKIIDLASEQYNDLLLSAGGDPSADTFAATATTLSALDNVKTERFTIINKKNP